MTHPLATPALACAVGPPLPLFPWQLWAALALNLVVSAVQLGAYGARLAGVITGRVAISISLFNLFVTASRLASLVYTPMFASLSDHARCIMEHGSPASHVQALGVFAAQSRMILLAATVGAMIGTALLPVFIHLYLRGIAVYERTGSIPRGLLRLIDPRVLASIARSAKAPRLDIARRFHLKAVPAKLLISNVLVTAVYTAGVVSAYYAGVIRPGAAGTAFGLSGLINGIGTVAFTLVVDPTSAFIVDQAVKGERSIDDVKSMVLWLSLTMVLGTLLSQLVLAPGAHLIAYVAHLLTR
ncbi:MAG TPA: DUF2837 family protein [Candidatus Dormibacteraeota bacterium]|nr:DUF2837 family protein [Candidatus Dormibacteraeota bacterium]